MTHVQKIKALQAKGVIVPAPDSIYVADDVDIDKISAHGVCLHPFTRIRGAKTVISAGAQIGEEAPVTIENCCLDNDVLLKGGYFRSSLFLAGASVGSGAHVREGCILEEEASCAHSVGLKQTILFPFVTLGSLINFCDCLMAGGTSRGNHSEVGSSYIHFNFTPHQDKATPSLMGDVPSGVMLNNPPIFLGGQGGMVGPAKINYGKVVSAGTIYRHNPDDVMINNATKGHDSDDEIAKIFRQGVYPNFSRIVRYNIEYMANLIALREWYKTVRVIFFQKKEYGKELSQMADEILLLALSERADRLLGFAKTVNIEVYKRYLGSGEKGEVKQQEEFLAHADEIARHFREAPTMELADDNFVKKICSFAETESYTSAIQNLDAETIAIGKVWLSAIISKATENCFIMLPSFDSVSKSNRSQGGEE
ncbi:MAG: hypothetical protein WCJ49_03755 [Deltaproteobacteria bacterium]